MHETPSATPIHRHHVYSNPGYPTLEIGGLPFYLVPSTSSPPPPPGGNSDSSSRDTSLTVNQQQHQQQPNPLLLYEPSGSSTRSGPIYEDIDRMCTYRGAPPPPLPPNHLIPQFHSPQRAGRIRDNGPLEGGGGGGGGGGDNRTYCNVQGPTASLSPFASPAKVPFSQHHQRPSDNSSEGSSKNNKITNSSGTSSSEVSFDSNSSGNNTNRNANVVVNPLTPSKVAKNRVASPSVYYYSDTLRPNRSNRGFEGDGSDHVYAETEEDLRPQLPSQRLASLAAARSSPATSERSNSRSRYRTNALSPTLSENSSNNSSKQRRRKGNRAEVRV